MINDNDKNDDNINSRNDNNTNNEIENNKSSTMITVVKNWR